MCLPPSSQSLPCDLPSPFPSLPIWSSTHVQVATVWIREGNYFFFSFFCWSASPCSCLTPSEGAARNGQLGQEKGQNFTFMVSVYLLIIHPQEEWFLPTFWVGFFISQAEVLLSAAHSHSPSFPPLFFVTTFSQLFLPLTSQLLPLLLLRCYLKPAKFQV